VKECNHSFSNEPLNNRFLGTNVKTVGQQKQMTAKRTALVLSLLGRTLIDSLATSLMSALRHIGENGSQGNQAIASVLPIAWSQTYAAPLNQHESSPNRFYCADWTYANIRGENP